MSEAALFFEDFLVTGPEGNFVSYPSVSPENSPGNYVPETSSPATRSLRPAKLALKSVP